MTVINLQYIDNHLALAFSKFTPKSYESECFKELLELASTKEFNKKYNYAIYTDEFQVPNNIFVPTFHLYYLTAEKKDVILLDEGLLEIPSVYNHHNFYVYKDEKLLKKLQDKHPTLTFKNINSIKDIDNVQTDE